MPFSKATKAKVLVAAARHCCVCHRYKGVKVEVHHMVPESKGGDSTRANAIALCFDCHADAGHYNPEHPRGTKFSLEELRLASDEWYDTVSWSSLTGVGDDDVLYCRYLLCKSFNALKEITDRDLSHVPADKPMLVQNDVLDHLTTLISSHPKDHRNDSEWGDHFPTHEQYAQAHPDVALFQRSSMNTYPYFEALRTPSRDELQLRLAPADSVTSALLDAGVPSSEISLAFGYTELCGDDRFQEIYRLRPLWAVFLAITNVTDKVLEVDSVSGVAEANTGTDYRSFFERSGPQPFAHDLPASALPPDGTILYPVATLLGPLSPGRETAQRTESSDLSTGEVQTLEHADFSQLTESIHKLGPAEWPSLIGIGPTANRGQAVHDFDLENLYAIDRFWECGSCPHLFFRRSHDRSLVYAGPLFGRAAGLRQNHTFRIPAYACQLVIAELEPEQTVVSSLAINSQEVTAQLCLAQGDSAVFDVKPGDHVSLEGHYFVGERVADRQPDPWQRNLAVAAYLTKMSEAGETAGPTS